MTPSPGDRGLHGNTRKTGFGVVGALVNRRAGIDSLARLQYARGLTRNGTGLLIRAMQVRILPGVPIYRDYNGVTVTQEGHVTLMSPQKP